MADFPSRTFASSTPLQSRTRSVMTIGFVMIEGRSHSVASAHRLERILLDFRVMPAEWRAADWVEVRLDRFLVRRWRALLVTMPSERLPRFAFVLARQVSTLAQCDDFTSIRLRQDILAQGVALYQEVYTVDRVRFLSNTH